MTVAAAGRARGSSKRSIEKLPKWGWLEWLTLSLPLMPALMFIPGLSALRTLARVAAFLIPLIAWGFVAIKGKKRSGRDDFISFKWMNICTIYIFLELLNPQGIASPLAALAQCMLLVSIISPIYWTAWDLKSSKQVPRLMMILFVCNAAGGFVGILQARYPGRFDPPAMPAFKNLGEDTAKAVFSYETDDGRTIMRPCGLTDSPGGAAGAGSIAGLLGLCWALRPIAVWKKGISLIFAFLGIAAVYYTQVRSALVVEVVCIAMIIALFVLQGNVAAATKMASTGASVIAGALVWVVVNVGSAVLDRFSTLVKEDQGQLYQNSRGMYVENTFTHMIWEAPLGAGLGRYGQSYGYFSNGATESLWAEVQWPAWAADGGIFLLFAYPVAVLLAIADSARIALKCPDKEVAYWAAVVAAINFSIFAHCFSFVPFVCAEGIQFWTFAAVIHAADKRVREELKRT